MYATGDLPATAKIQTFWYQAECSFIFNRTAVQSEFFSAFFMSKISATVWNILAEYLCTCHVLLQNILKIQNNSSELNEHIRKTKIMSITHEICSSWHTDDLSLSTSLQIMLHMYTFTHKKIKKRNCTKQLEQY